MTSSDDTVAAPDPNTPALHLRDMKRRRQCHHDPKIALAIFKPAARRPCSIAEPDAQHRQ
jgi:hypothetical protein